MRSIVIYNSKTGFTEKYAHWIAEKIGCEAIGYKHMTAEQWKNRDVIIYGGGIMAGMIAGWDKIKSNPAAEGKRMILFAVGATQPEETEMIETVKNKNLTEEEQKRIPFFYFEGGINYERMGLITKMMLKLMYKSLKGKKDRTPEETGMMRIFEKSFDHSKEEYIIPLAECAEKL